MPVPRLEVRLIDIAATSFEVAYTVKSNVWIKKVSFSYPRT